MVHVHVCCCMCLCVFGRNGLSQPSALVGWINCCGAGCCCCCCDGSRVCFSLLYQLLPSKCVAICASARVCVRVLCACVFVNVCVLRIWHGLVCMLSTRPFLLLTCVSNPQ